MGRVNCIMSALAILAAPRNWCKVGLLMAEFEYDQYEKCEIRLRMGGHSSLVLQSESNWTKTGIGNLLKVIF
ncbi:hypothetical protein B0J13DRAFT_162715 [Dactylonectria estremocensis]|uniref:Uncharacterized protein n=1 Tax=Dactylonectria estremocensis TaxID=1079267 RepID=A0A9P9IHI4_9HYPO|nr:hypothetical protein B0J13DRAFT_162715 [Dactylonectria estremocensis]